MVRNQKKARKKKSFRARFFAALYVLPLMLLAVLVLQRCQKNMERAEKIEKQTKELEAKYQSEVERNDSLKKGQRRRRHQRVCRESGKEKLGLVDRGEVIFKVEH